MVKTNLDYKKETTSNLDLASVKGITDEELGKLAIETAKMELETLEWVLATIDKQKQVNGKADKALVELARVLRVDSRRGSTMKQPPTDKEAMAMAIALAKKEGKNGRNAK